MDKLPPNYRVRIACVGFLGTVFYKLQKRGLFGWSTIVESISREKMEKVISELREMDLL